MKQLTSLVLSLMCVLFCQNALAAKGKIYKWVDNQGVTHYSANPELNNPAEIIKPKTGHSDPVTYTAPTTPNTKNQTAKQESQKDPERCESARKNQSTLKTFSRIKTKGEDGEYYYLSQDEQQQKLNEAEQAVAESCD
jgi:Domain of unknown function (DUF4124)